MLNIAEISKILQQFGNERISTLKSEISKQGLTDTGKSANSLEQVIAQTSDSLSLTISGVAYLFALNEGAKPIEKRTTGQFVENIEAWAKRKLSLEPKEARGLAFGYLKKRLGDGVGGQTTDARGNYKVPNPYNPGGVVFNSFPESAMKELEIELLRFVGSEYQKTVGRAIKQSK